METGKGDEMVKDETSCHWSRGMSNVTDKVVSSGRKEKGRTGTENGDKPQSFLRTGCCYHISRRRNWVIYSCTADNAIANVTVPTESNKAPPLFSCNE